MCTTNHNGDCACVHRCIFRCCSKIHKSMHTYTFERICHAYTCLWPVYSYKQNSKTKISQTVVVLGLTVMFILSKKTKYIQVTRLGNTRFRHLSLRQQCQANNIIMRFDHILQLKKSFLLRWNKQKIEYPSKHISNILSARALLIEHSLWWIRCTSFILIGDASSASDFNCSSTNHQNFSIHLQRCSEIEWQIMNNDNLVVEANTTSLVAVVVIMYAAAQQSILTTM